jgi:hypothetical protein
LAPPRAGDIKRSRADCGRAMQTLGVRSATPFVDGVAATWAWHHAISLTSDASLNSADARADALPMLWHLAKSGLSLRLLDEGS